VVSVDTSSGVPVFTTKGDANEDADVDPVSASAVQGKLWFGVPQLGRLSAILHSPKGVGLLVVMICAVIAAAPGPRPSTATADADRTEPEPADRRAPADLVDAANARTVVMAAVDAGPPGPTNGKPSPSQPRVRRASLPPVPRPVPR
jgi:signal peptidase I